MLPGVALHSPVRQFLAWVKYPSIKLKLITNCSKFWTTSSYGILYHLYATSLYGHFFCLTLCVFYQYLACFVCCYATMEKNQSLPVFLSACKSNKTAYYFSSILQNIYGSYLTASMKIIFRVVACQYVPAVLH